LIFRVAEEGFHGAIGGDGAFGIRGGRDDVDGNRVFADEDLLDGEEWEDDMGTEVLFTETGFEIEMFLVEAGCLKRVPLQDEQCYISETLGNVPGELWIAFEIFHFCCDGKLLSRFEKVCYGIEEMIAHVSTKGVGL